MRPSRLIALAAALVFGAAVEAGPPQRVVSLNVCTDQLALLLAAPGQLVSVSRLASDPRSSAMAEEAAKLPANNAGAEEIVLLKPDLVLAGAYTARAAVEMLESLGYPVELFQPATSLEETRANIRRAGALLGQEARAAHVIAAFDNRLAALTDAPEARPRTAYYLPFAETAGRETLAGDIMAAAGLANIADEKGLSHGGRLPMEELVLANPDLVLVGRPYGRPARETEFLHHPALAATGALRVVGDSADWICGTPAVLDAVAELRGLRRDWEAAR